MVTTSPTVSGREHGPSRPRIAVFSPTDDGISWQLGQEWDPKASVPAEVRRFRQVITATSLIIIGLVATLDLPPLTGAQWSQQWWRFVVYTVLITAQTAYRMRTGNVRRRTTSTVVEGAVVIGLFWLNPWLVVLGRLLGAFLGWTVAGFLGRRQRVFYLSCFAIEILVVARIDYSILPGDAVYGWRPLAVAGVVWAGSVIGRMVTVVAARWIRGGHLRATENQMHRSAALAAAAATVFGLSAAMMIDLAWIGVFPTVALGMLLTRTGNSVRRVGTMERALDELVWLSARTNDAPPDQIENDLVEAICRIRENPTCAVVRRSNSGVLEWFGPVTPVLRASATGLDELHRLADHAPERFETRPAGVGSVAVWTVDARRSSLLVIESSRRPGQLRGLQDAIDTLVASARLGIINAHQLDDLQAEADRERLLARTDLATGLPNSFAATTAVDERLTEPERDASLTAIVLSIDGLSEIVDVLGPDAGEALTRAFAIRLARRAPGFAARIATNVFLAIIDGGAEEALPHVARLTEVAKTAVGDEVFTYQISAGVAVCRPDQDLAAEELFRRADLALHDTRRRGEIVVFGDVEAEHEARRAAIRLRLAGAIADRSVRPAFQPQIDLQTGRLVGLEVLARWNDEELGFVSPGEFIEIAEQSRQVEALTVSMLIQALDAAMKWIELGVTVPISVNLSAQSLMWPKFLQHLVDIVTSYDVATEILTAEITESTLVEGSAVIDAIGRLRDLGARISIDDFGTGYSALSYMNTLPIHELKIDRSMVETIGDVDRPAPIVRRLIDLCTDLHYSVVAEGIETEQQAVVLKQMGCHIGQGYFFARPMMEAEMTDWIVEDHQFELAALPEAVVAEAMAIDPQSAAPTSDTTMTRQT